jgi:hypothetical protein
MLDQVADALANNSSRIIFDKASLSSQLAGVFCSMWRATGQPGQGAIPTTAALCTKALTGAIGFTNQTDPATSYIGFLEATCSNNVATLEIHDRLAHMGGLVFNVTTSQNANIDLLTLSVPAERIGSADYGDVQWWLEVYTAGGATASNLTLNATFDDASTGNLNVLAVGGTLGASRMYSLGGLRTTSQQARNIRGISTGILSASTGTAGNWGITATRPRAKIAMPLANFLNQATWEQTGLSNVPNDSCLFPIILPTTTSSGTLRGGGKIIHG